MILNQQKGLFVKVYSNSSDNISYMVSFITETDFDDDVAAHHHNISILQNNKALIEKYQGFYFFKFIRFLYIIKTMI